MINTNDGWVVSVSFGFPFTKGQVLTGRIRASSESRPPYDLTPPLRGASSIGRAFGLDLLQRFFVCTSLFPRNQVQRSLGLTGFEGRLDRIWVELTKVRLENVRIL